MGFVIHLRGLPWSASEQEIVGFLEINPDDVQTVEITQTPEGRPSGEAFVTIGNQASAEQALQKHKETFPGSTRWVEIKKSNSNEAGKSANPRSRSKFDGVIRCRGIPFSATVDDLKEFFAGLDMVEELIFFPTDRGSGSNGECFVQFANWQSADAALAKHREHMMGRYIEVFKSSNNDMRKAMIMHIKKTGPGEDTYNSGPAVPSNWGGLNLGGSGGPMRGGRNNSGRDAPYSKNQSWNGPKNDGYGGNNNFGAPPQGFGGPPQNGSFRGQNNGFNSGFGGPPTNQGFQAQSGQSGWPQQQHWNNAHQQGGFGGPPQQQVQPQAVNAQPGILPAGSSNCPFPNCVGVAGIPAGTENKQIQEFFKPVKAIAVNMTMGNGMGDVAFTNHADACAAMANNGKPLNGANITLTLKSEGPPPVNAGFTML